MILLLTAGCVARSPGVSLAVITWEGCPLETEEEVAPPVWPVGSGIDLEGVHEPWQGFLNYPVVVVSRIELVGGEALVRGHEPVSVRGHIWPRVVPGLTLGRVYQNGRFLLRFEGMELDLGPGESWGAELEDGVFRVYHLGVYEEATE